MGLIVRLQFTSVATILVVATLFGNGACDSICPNGMTNITASKGVIEYPESGNYGINETKCWRIEVPDTYRGIYFIFSRYDIEVCKSCGCDFIQVSPIYSHLPFLNKVCRRNSDNYLENLRLLGVPNAAPISATTVYLRFVSDDTVHRRGFNVSFIAESDTGGITSFLNATEDETIEFGTPKVNIKNYPENFEQQWYLFVPEGRQVQIDFDTFELEQSEKCKNDYVEIREEGSKGPILTGHICGSTMPSSIQSAGNKVWVQFKSDSNATTVYKGFNATFKAGQGKLSVSNPVTLLFLSALLMFASKSSVL